jgi:uncharacterized protein (TIGR02757 family)
MRFSSSTRDILELRYKLYATPAFIVDDPVQVPHRYNKAEDIEISGFLVSTIAWGQRKSIIRSALSLMERMDDAPFDFIVGSGEKEFARFSSFVYRTFQPVDCLFVLSALRDIYRRRGGLRAVFEDGYGRSGHIKGAIASAREEFLKADHLPRSRKHLPDVLANSAAKRMNMFLRWMVREDGSGIDFGIWKGIPSSALMIPLDVHTGRESRRLGLLTRVQNDWKAVEELTANLRLYDRDDPVRFDIALFGMGIHEKANRTDGQ